MKRTSLLGSALLASVLALQGGCADGDDTLIILNNQTPGEDCAISATVTGDFISRGRIDTGAEFGYRFTPVVQSTVAQSELASRLTFIKAAEVDLVFEEGFSSELDSFRVALSGTVQPNGGTASFEFEIIPKSVLDDLAGSLAENEVTVVQAKVKMVAELDGSDIESNTFTYPVEVCNGCLKRNEGECSNLPASLVIEEGGVCNDMQDAFITCCDDGAGNEICPADANAGLDCGQSVLTFDNFGQAFMNTYCQGCHASDAVNRQGAPQNVTFDDRAMIEARADRISARAGVGSTMPPSGAAPSDAERAQLVEWLSCGVQ